MQEQSIPSFSPACSIALQNQTWYLARIRKGSPSDREPDFREPRPWKAVKVDINRHTFFQGCLVERPDALPTPGLGVCFSCEDFDIDIAHPLTRDEALEWLQRH
jgi:hypothetical protein